MVDDVCRGRCEARRRIDLPFVELTEVAEERSEGRALTTGRNGELARELRIRETLAKVNASDGRGCDTHRGPPGGLLSTN